MRNEHEAHEKAVIGLAITANALREIIVSPDHACRQPSPAILTACPDAADEWICPTCEAIRQALLHLNAVDGLLAEFESLLMDRRTVHGVIASIETHLNNLNKPAGEARRAA
jgi:hypothetical protein